MMVFPVGGIGDGESEERWYQIWRIWRMRNQRNIGTNYGEKWRALKEKKAFQRSYVRSHKSRAHPPGGMLLLYRKWGVKRALNEVK